MHSINTFYGFYTSSRSQEFSSLVVFLDKYSGAPIGKFYFKASPHAADILSEAVGGFWGISQPQNNQIDIQAGIKLS